MKFIYLFIVSFTLLFICHCSAQMTWFIEGPVRWADNCDFESNDLSNIRSSSGEECGVLCYKKPPCTHFVWTQESSTCWLKTIPPSFIANIEKKVIVKPKSTCGFLHISWHPDNWAYNCIFDVGNNLNDYPGEGKDCGPLCKKSVDCTHFTWQHQHNPKQADSLNGTCYLQTGGASKGQETFSPNGVCGIKISATVSTTTSPIEDCTCDC